MKPKHKYYYIAQKNEEEWNRIKEKIKANDLSDLVLITHDYLYEILESHPGKEDDRIWPILRWEIADE